MPPAARKGDTHTCPLVAPPPAVAGVVEVGAPTVNIEKFPAARLADPCSCASGSPDAILVGEPTVRICGQPAARMGDSTGHGGMILTGAAITNIGSGYGWGAAAAESFCMSMAAASGAIGISSGATGNPQGSAGASPSDRRIADQAGQDQDLVGTNGQSQREVGSFTSTGASDAKPIGNEEGDLQNVFDDSSSSAERSSDQKDRSESKPSPADIKASKKTLADALATLKSDELKDILQQDPSGNVSQYRSINIKKIDDEIGIKFYSPSFGDSFRARYDPSERLIYLPTGLTKEEMTLSLSNELTHAWQDSVGLFEKYPDPIERPENHAIFHAHLESHSSLITKRVSDRFDTLNIDIFSARNHPDKNGGWLGAFVSYVTEAMESVSLMKDEDPRQQEATRQDAFREYKRKILEELNEQKTGMQSDKTGYQGSPSESRSSDVVINLGDSLR